MARIQIGGDPSQYMDPPTLAVGTPSQGGGPSIIASILDALGIQRQVAKGDKPAKAPKGKAGVTAPMEAGPVPTAQVPDIVGTMTQALSADPAAPLTPFGQKWLDSVKPLMSFDPGPSKAKQN